MPEIEREQELRRRINSALNGRFAAQNARSQLVNPQVTQQQAGFQAQPSVALAPQARSGLSQGISSDLAGLVSGSLTSGINDESQPGGSGDSGGILKALISLFL